MKTTGSVLSALALAMLLAAGGIGLSGCGGESPREALWQDAQMIARDYEHRPDRSDAEQFEMFHSANAVRLEGSLDAYRDGPEDLRRLLAEIAEGEGRLGRGDLSASEAEELIARHEEYFSHINQRRMPPDY